MAYRSDMDSATGLVDKMIGTAYPVVREVATSIEQIRHVSAHLENVYRVHESIEAIDDLGVQSEGLAALADNLTSLLIINSNLDLLTNISDSMDTLTEMNGNLGAMIQAVTDTNANVVLSRSWAETAEDIPVVTGEFSAKHYSKKANTEFILTQAVKVQAETAKTAAETARAAAEVARDAALVAGPKYVDEPTGRAAVANGAVFFVQGSGDIAAYEYRRVDSASSTYLTSYPSANYTQVADEKGSYARFAENRRTSYNNRPKALIMILLGQSNNTSRGTNISGTVHADAFMPIEGNALPEMPWYTTNAEFPGHWNDVISVVQHAEGVGESPMSGIITTVMGGYFQRMYGMSVAIGARNLEVLNDMGPRTNIYAYTHRLCDIARADGYQPIVAFCAHHGEANMFAGTTEAAYITLALEYYNMCQLLAAQAMEKPDYIAPIVFFHPIENYDTPANDGETSRDIHNAIRQLTKLIPNAIYGGGCYHYSASGDRIHQSDQGFRSRGEYTGYLIKQYFEKGIREHALEVVDVTWSGTTATVLFNEDIIIDTTINWGAAVPVAPSLGVGKQMNGMEWVDNGVHIQITAAVAQGRKIVLTLASVPVGTVDQQRFRIACQTTTSATVANLPSTRPGCQVRVNEPGRSAIYQYGDPFYGVLYRWAVPQRCNVRAA